MGNIINNINWFINEINRLVDENIIDQTVSQKLSQYYCDKIDKIKSEKQLKSKNRGVKLVVIILSVISALLISSGIILIIAYNWYSITKEVKTFFSFLFVIIPQLLSVYFFLFFKKKMGVGLKEGLAVLWAVIFGGMIAFIGQIYKLPTDYGSFLFIWAISTLVITYIFNSLSTFVLYLALIISHTIFMQANEGIGLLFYPLYFAVIPLYIYEERKQNIFRLMLYKYLLIATLISCFGVSLEKAVPGLWILSYFSLFVIFYVISFFVEKGNKLFMSPFKIAGILGSYVFGFLLIFDNFWKEIGWKFYRGGGKFNEIASVFDYSITIILILSSIACFVYFYIKNRKFEKNIIVLIASNLFLLLMFIIVSLKPEMYKESSYLIQLLLSIIALYYFLNSILDKKSGKLQNSLMFFLLLPILVKFIASSVSGFNNSGIFLVGLSLFFTTLFCFGKYLEIIKGNKVFKIIKIIGIIGVCILAFSTSWNIVSDTFDIYEFNKVPSIITFFEGLSLVLMVLIAFLPLILIIKEKKMIHYIVPVFSIILLLIYLLNFFNAAEISGIAITWFSNSFILAFALFSFYLSFKTNSMLIANSSAIFLTITIIFRFFDSTIGFLSRGVAFMFCGIVILILNISLANRNKKSQIEEK